MTYNKQIVEDLFNIAKESRPVARARVAACIVHKKLVAPIVAINALKTHPFQAKYSSNYQAIYLHAEISAIHKALRVLTLDELEKSELYIVRARVNSKRTIWSHGLAKPCVGCTRCIATFGITKVYYTLDE